MEGDLQVDRLEFLFDGFLFPGRERCQQPPLHSDRLCFNSIQFFQFSFIYIITELSVWEFIIAQTCTCHDKCMVHNIPENTNKKCSSAFARTQNDTKSNVFFCPTKKGILTFKICIHPLGVSRTWHPLFLKCIPSKDHVIQSNLNSLFFY